MVTGKIIKQKNIHLLRIEEYSDQEKLQIRNDLPAVNRYLSIIEGKKPITPSDKIRVSRHYYWLRSVFSTYFKKNTTAEVCKFWSISSEKIISRAYNESNLNESNITIFAVGKLGALELNLSSDVDLLLITPDATPQSKIQAKAQMKSLKVFQSLLHEVTDFSFALRLDFDLRPGGRFGPLISTPSQFEDYYGTFGETWERLALIRLSAIIGDNKLVKQINDISRKFIYRKHLNFTLLEDLKELRPKIHHSDFHNRSNSDENNSYNLKLGLGGIRDIELYIHALQIIHGGRNPSLHTQQTDDAILLLKKVGFLPKDDANFFLDSYWILRDLENRVQSINDQQTHFVELDNNNYTFQNFSVEQLNHLTKSVDSLVSQLLGIHQHTKDVNNILPKNLPQQKLWLQKKGVSQETIDSTWEELISNQARSKNHLRDEKSRYLFLESFINELDSKGLDKNLALHNLKDFIKSTRAKTSYYSFFNHNPLLIENLVFLFSTSPYLGHLLATRPELSDSFFFRSQELSSTDPSIFLNQLSERRLVTDLVAASDFLRQKNIPMLLSGLSLNADEISQLLINFIKKELNFEQSTLNILTLGKWAGQELGFRSDLDFIFVTENESTIEDHKVAKKFISYISTPTNNGIIYNIDLRLRPSGKSGPLIVSKKYFVNFLKNEAEIWERQAYSKSRSLNSDNSWFSNTLIEKGVTNVELKKLKSIRQQLKNENQSTDNHKLDLKHFPGGIIDIEFAIQTELLRKQTSSNDVSTLGMLDTLCSISEKWNLQKNVLIANYSNLRFIEQTYQLTSNQTGSILKTDSNSFIRLARLNKKTPDQLRKEIKTIFSDVQQVLSSLDPNELNI